LFSGIDQEGLRLPQGSLVVEIVGKFDGRMLPLCGYHGSLAAVFGIHHYVYYYDYKGGREHRYEGVDDRGHALN